LIRVLLYSIVFVVLFGTLSLQDPNQIKLRSLQKDLELSPDDTAKVSQLIRISSEYLSSNSSTSLDYAQHALALAEELGVEKSIDKALFNITLVTYTIGLNEIASQYMLRMLNMAMERKDYLEVGRYYFNLGSLNHILGQHKEAEFYFTKGWDMIDSIYTSQNKSIPQHELATIYNNIAHLNLSMDDLVESEQYFIKGLELGSISEITPRNYVNLNLGMVNLYLKKKEHTKIKPILDKIIEFQKTENDQAGLSISYKFEGDFYEIQNQHQKAISSYMKAWSLAGSVENIATSQYVVEALHKIYTKMGVADSALKYLNLTNAFNDQMKAEEARKELLKAEIIREYEARQHSLDAAAQAKSLRLIYIIVFIGSITLVSVWLFIRFRKKYQQSEQQLQKVEEVAQQVGQEAEVLKADLERKDKELATQVMYSIQKNEMITDLVETLQSKSKNDLASQQEDIRKIIKTLEQATDQGVWEEFELRFQQVHSGFYDQLQANYPNLTLNERRLCAFLRLDMTTKEIATITGQTVRAVEMARIRLRKKMNLTKSDTSLFEVLSSL